MIFKVLADEPTEVRDPDTNKVIAIIDRHKVKVQVSEIYEAASICRTYKKKYIGGGIAAAAAAFLSQDLYAQSKEVVETLKVTDASFPLNTMLATLHPAIGG
jgi:predicted NAD/FAD-dependent oxidoreductase